ncbi:MAG: hypothetical protein R3Y36_06590 [Spirochaetales bacterium]
MKKSAVITATFASNIEKVWQIVTDNHNFRWRSDVSDIQIADENHFIEISTNGYKTEFEITDKKSFKYYAFKIKGQNMSGEWQGIFSECENGTHIEFIEKITVKNPLMYVLLGFYLKKQQSRYIRDLRKALGE